MRRNIFKELKKLSETDRECLEEFKSRKKIFVNLNKTA